MPASPEEKAHALEDFAPLLERLEELALEFVVIGGCAVGAYARLRGEEILTKDLDILADLKTLRAIVAWAGRHGIQVLKMPKPRSAPVAVLRWEEKEINIVTDSIGLPAPREAAETARVFVLSKAGGLEVDLADPFDILRNKVLLDRPKDRPHVEVLRRFVEEEVVEAFQKDAPPRRRIRPARLYLEATRSSVLPKPLAGRLASLARVPADFRFLLSVAPEEAEARELLQRARAISSDRSFHEELEGIFRARRFEERPRARPRAPVRAKVRARSKAPARRPALKGSRRRIPKARRGT